MGWGLFSFVCLFVEVLFVCLSICFVVVLFCEEVMILFLVFWDFLCIFVLMCIFLWFLVLVCGSYVCGFVCIEMGFVGSVHAFDSWVLWDFGLLYVLLGVFMYLGLL